MTRKSTRAPERYLFDPPDKDSGSGGDRGIAAIVGDLRRIQGRSRRGDPISSTVAGEAATADGRGARHAATILAVLLAAGEPLTGAEICERCDLERNQISRRLPDLERFGMISRGAIRRARNTGRPEIEWQANRARALFDVEA